jgi:hypothetical protein
MTRTMTNRIDGVLWDFVYQAAVVGLGVAATVAVFLQATGL